MNRFIIRGPKVDGEFLYWNNVVGWGGRSTAGRYKLRPVNAPLETSKIISVKNKH